MGLFKSSSEKQILRDLVAAIGARDKLTARLVSVEIAVADLRMAAERLALESASDEALGAAEANTRIMVDRATTLKAALAQTEDRVAELERIRDQETDKKVRNQASVTLERLAREIVEAAAALDSAAIALADCTAKVTPTIHEATGLQNFAAICRAEVPQAAEMVAKLLRAHAVGVLDGSQPATLRPPEPPPETIIWPPPGVEVQESGFKYQVLNRGPAYRLPVPREGG
jgi:hypothetical protein